ncbi:DExH-box ATP-dependent RNA helicase DExH11-like [Rutidosis leptorrhynchoides]|uniref:DExH-box ATP-dependent RNA helicase DExH11-like n=1 Tax=Rutidosis leptorrhynchoides TaxID=125765 RepID=UPI003A99C4DA
MDRIDTVKELPFRVGFTGHSGHIRIEPLPSVQQSSPVNSLPEFILPPAFPRETPESIKKFVEDKYLLPGLDPDEFSAEKAGKQWEFDWFDQAKIQLEPTMPRSVVVPAWELPFRRSSDVEKWEPASVQVDVSELMVEADNSIGVRISGPPKDFVKGSMNNRPFRPGGLDDSQSIGRIVPEGASNGEWVWEVLNGAPAQIIPPSFKQGMDLGDLKGHSCSWIIHEDHSVPKRTSESTLSVQFDDLFKKAWEEDITELPIDGDTSESEIEIQAGSPKPIPQEAENKLELPEDARDPESSVIDQILSTASEEMSKTLNDSSDAGQQQSKEPKVWAVTGGSDGIADRFNELVPDMALDFPFELDAFQKEAIYYLEKGESVFVAAHTSAGKTVVAEYAFALATKHCTRAVYTAPIKTISNQKYRDFSGKFDVGLLTGDVSLRPEASCLIMTTEILRSMLYRGADIIRDIEWVIFDEVHYVNDVERGVVWEEVIIMLPRHINFVLLSATVPNTIEFADWIGRTKQKQIRVTGTTKRPVPLEHCLFYSGELYKICEHEKFLSQGLQAAKAAHKRKSMGTASGGSGSYPSLPASQDNSRYQKPGGFARGKPNQQTGPPPKLGNFGGASRGGGSNNWGSRISEKSLWLSLINKLSKTSLLPVVIFCFSKNRCDKSADNLYGTDLTSRSEKSEIRIFCDKAFSRLKGSDRNLPQIVRVQGLLHRGIGVHHAGLLPIVKEVVEMLFCRGVIKVLFSTETFAMGVNAPARTVVFDTVRKFDGKEFRQLLPGEYTQMAGRAGRRGLDKIGSVLVMCRDEIPDESDLKNVITGSATRLESQFRLTYIMIMHLLRVEELKVEDMLKRSFAEFHAQKKLPEQQQLLMRKLAQPAKSIDCIKGEPAIEEYYEWYQEAEMYSNRITEAVVQSSASQTFLQPGRVVVVKSQSGQDHLLGVVLKTPSSNNKQYIVMVLTPLLPSTIQSSNDPQNNSSAGLQLLMPKSKRGMDDDFYTSGTTRKGSGIVKIKLPHRGNAAGASYEVKEIDNKEFLSICNAKFKPDLVGLLEDGSSAAYSKTVQTLLNQKVDGNKYPPALDPVKDLKLKDVSLVEAYYKWNHLLQKMSENKCHNCPKLEEHIKVAREIRKYKEEVKALKFQMSDEALQQMPHFQGRIDVLKEIGCIDDELVVQIKGRVACEMNSGEELICTECLFENQLDDLEPEEAVALMSAFVFQQRNASEPSLTPRLAQAKERLYNTAIKLGQLQSHFKIQIDPEEYARENLKFGLVEVVYEWAKGTPFADICELTDVPEGLIVRTIVRLDETCREFRNAAAIMGNSALYKKMEVASNAIKRDIVFAASLYITGL